MGAFFSRTLVFEVGLPVFVHPTNHPSARDGDTAVNDRV